jgi:hypothetical protein
MIPRVTAFASNCPDGCPPQEAGEVAGTVIRFVRNDPPTPTDMQTYADSGKPADDACLACALSVLRRLDDVPTARKAMPWFKKRLVARAELTPAHGRLLQTGAHAWHFSLWVASTQASTIHQQFSVVPA